MLVVIAARQSRIQILWRAYRIAVKDYAVDQAECSLTQSAAERPLQRFHKPVFYHFFLF